MDSAKVRAILGAYRAGEPETEDARFQEARAAAEADPELAQWWAEHQELDRIIAAKLQEVEVPHDLKARILAYDQRTADRTGPHTVERSSWSRRWLLVAAAVVGLAVLFGSWRGPFQPAASLADYRDEMVSFVRLKPSLDLETTELSEISRYLAKSAALSQIEVPAGLRKLDPMGCRTLRFRGHDVALICFKRSGNRMAHLLVIDRAALRGFNKDRPEFAEHHGWMTAAWTEGDAGYLLAVEGDRSAVEQFLSDS